MPNTTHHHHHNTNAKPNMNSIPETAVASSRNNPDTTTAPSWTIQPSMWGAPIGKMPFVAQPPKPSMQPQQPRNAAIESAAHWQPQPQHPQPPVKRSISRSNSAFSACTSPASVATNPSAAASTASSRNGSSSIWETASSKMSPASLMYGSLGIDAAAGSFASIWNQIPDAAAKRTCNSTGSTGSADSGASSSNSIWAAGSTASLPTSATAPVYFNGGGSATSSSSDGYASATSSLFNNSSSSGGSSSSNSGSSQHHSPKPNEAAAVEPAAVDLRQTGCDAWSRCVRDAPGAVVWSQQQTKQADTTDEQNQRQLAEAGNTAASSCMQLFSEEFLTYLNLIN